MRNAVSIADFKRVTDLYRKTVTVDVPSDLIVRKGKSAVGRRRCQRAQLQLADAVRANFVDQDRRPFRSDVAIHLKFYGMSLDRPSEVFRTVKATLDSLQGPVYADDRAVALLDVSFEQGPEGARISLCSARQYADAFDVLAGASDPRGRDSCESDEEPTDDLFIDDHPWSWTDETCGDEYRIEETKEFLDLLEYQSPDGSDDLRNDLISSNKRWLADHERRRLLAAPFSPADRPGPPNIAARVWGETTLWPSMQRVHLPAPAAGKAGSWTDQARAAFSARFASWPHMLRLLTNGSTALDIAAIGPRASTAFDIDNLAERILRALRDVAPEMPALASYRAYRRHGSDDGVCATFHSPTRAENLRWLMSGNLVGASLVTPDADGHVYRRRPADDHVNIPEYLAPPRL